MENTHPQDKYKFSMKKKLQQFFTIILASSLLAACSMPVRPTSTPIVDQALAGTIVAMTLQAIHTRVPENTQATTPPAQLEATAINSAVPSATPSPQIISTATASSTSTPTYSAPFLVFDGNTNCREGPGTGYKVVTVLGSGQKIEPVGVQANYWVVKNPNGPGTCWVVTDFATPSGSTWSLPTVIAPATSTLQAPPVPSWTKWDYRCDYAANGFNVTMILSWSDLATNLTGYRVYRDGQVIATLGADVTTYTDTTPLDNGKTLTYYVEAYKDAAHASSSNINASCQ